MWVAPLKASTFSTNNRKKILWFIASETMILKGIQADAVMFLVTSRHGISSTWTLKWMAFEYSDIVNVKRLLQYPDFLEDYNEKLNTFFLYWRVWCIFFFVLCVQLYLSYCFLWHPLKSFQTAWVGQANALLRADRVTAICLWKEEFFEKGALRKSTIERELWCDQEEMA